MTKVIAYGAHYSISDLKPMEIERAEPRENEVAIDILFCGVCHSDVHQVKNEWKNTQYPCVPGHEIVGRVSKAGAAVRQHKVGDLVGVGCMVDSCHACESCQDGLEQYCIPGATATYNGNMREPAKHENTFGGYSQSITVREDFVLRIPEGMDPAATAPILCAGVTTYSPLKHWKVGPGSKVGVAGFGGLGQMAIKIAVAMGAEVTVLTGSKEKKSDALALGAKKVVCVKSKKEMKAAERSLDFILSTIPQAHDANPYVPLLKRDGTLTIVGCLVPLKKGLNMPKLIMDRRSVGTSLIGSIAETQEVLDFCAEHGIASTIRTISVDKVNEAYAQVDKGEVDYRFVIDIETLRGKKPADETLIEKALDAVA